MHESRLSQPRGTVDCVPQFEPEKPQKESAFSDLSCSMSGDKYAQEWLGGGLSIVLWDVEIITEVSETK